MTSKKIILAGGGTAGHIEPALAVAVELQKMDPELRCEFIGTKTGLENALVPSRGFPLRVIPKVALPREFSFSIIKWPFALIGSVFTSIRIIKGASVVIGFGGYVAASAYLAAVVLRIPIVIHEANAKPGWANRLGRVFAKVVTVNFGSVQRKWQGSINTGMPLREDIVSISQLSKVELAQIRINQAKDWGLSPDKPIIAVFGGSLGSERINKVVSEYLSSQKYPIQIAHAVGMHNTLPIARTGYFPIQYFHNIAKVYAAADIVICRSGAVTCAELAVVNRYAILIPLPIGNGEQEANADELMAKSSATMIKNSDFTAEWLGKNIEAEIAKSHTYSASAMTVKIKETAKEIAKLALAASK